MWHVRAVFLDHGGGTLGIIEVPNLHLPLIVNLGRLHTSCYIFSFLRERT